MQHKVGFSFKEISLKKISSKKISSKEISSLEIFLEEISSKKNLLKFFSFRSIHNSLSKILFWKHSHWWPDIFYQMTLNWVFFAYKVLARRLFSFSWPLSLWVFDAVKRNSFSLSFIASTTKVATIQSVMWIVVGVTSSRLLRIFNTCWPNKNSVSRMERGNICRCMFCIWFWRLIHT